METDLIRDKLLEIIEEAPYPYALAAIAFIADRVEGKPRNAEPPPEPIVDLSNLSADELLARVHSIAERLRNTSKGLPVIDVAPEKDPDTLSPEELQEEIRRAQAEVDRANQNLRRVTEKK